MWLKTVFKKHRAVLTAVVMLLLALFYANSYADQYTERTYISYDGQELSYLHFAPAKKQQQDTLIIWIAPGYGLNARHHNIAEKLIQKGIEVWMIDYADALFLPHTTSSMREMDARNVQAMIVAARKQTGKNILLLSQSYGAIPALKGIREWQLARSKNKSEPKNKSKPNNDYLLGCILFSPDLYATIPALGLPPVYEPVVSATNMPVMIFQGEKRNTRWQLKHVVNTLEVGGSQVFVKIQRGVTALFYSGDDSPAARVRLQTVTDDILNVIKLFKRTPRPTIAAPMRNIKVKKSALDNRIKTFVGAPKPPVIDTLDIKGKHYLRNNYRGKVTVVNFWATWCPPCVKEIPSLNRLRKKLKGDKFELISINYAETKTRVREFLKQVDVDFPVLMDESGGTAAEWNVLVFPSTFVIGADGRIHYGVNAAIEWDSDEVIKKLTALQN